jgi:hypothetical protein
MTFPGYIKDILIPEVVERVINVLLNITLLVNPSNRMHWLDTQDFILVYTISSKIFISIIEWVSDSYLTPIQQFCQLYHGENKLICNEMRMKSAFF